MQLEELVQKAAKGAWVRLDRYPAALSGGGRRHVYRDWAVDVFPYRGELHATIVWWPEDAERKDAIPVLRRILAPYFTEE